MLCPNMEISPRVGRRPRYMSVISEVFPAPLAPLKKWNEPGSRRETDIAQHFRAYAVAEADIFKADHGSIALVRL